MWQSQTVRDVNIIQAMRSAFLTNNATDTNTLKICNTYCFCTLTMLTQRASMLRLATLSVLYLLELFPLPHHTTQRFENYLFPSSGELSYYSDTAVEAYYL